MCLLWVEDAIILSLEASVLLIADFACKMIHKSRIL